MEVKKAHLRVRKPLSDCTNTTITKSSQSSSSTLSPSTLKPPKPIRASAIVNLLNNGNIHSLPGPNPTDFTETSRAGSVRVHLADSTHTPRLKQSSASEFREGFEPQLSYSRRHATLKRRITGKDIGMPLNRSAASTVPDVGGITKKRGHNGRFKRQLLKSSSQDASNKNLPQDFIEQQRLYFAEIDAFELLEEEVGSDEDKEVG